MYQIKCDGEVLYDPRSEKITISSPKLSLAANAAGSASFKVHTGNKCYSDMHKLRSMFEILEDGEPIFRGRMTSDLKDMKKSKVVELEGCLAFLNDSIVRPFAWLDIPQIYGNAVKSFMAWLINNHNNQVEPFQRFKLGKITLDDTRFTTYREDYTTSWQAVKDIIDNRGGYLRVRYDADGSNFIDYLQDLTEENAQPVQLGENLINLTDGEDAAETYSAILPIGADGLTIRGAGSSGLPSDLEIRGDTVVSNDAVRVYGFIVRKVEYKEITDRSALLNAAASELNGSGAKLANTVTVRACDLHYTDKEIQSFRVNKYTRVLSKVHGYDTRYRLTELSLDLFNPQNTVITMGDTVKKASDISATTSSSVSTVRAEVQGVVNNATDSASKAATAAASVVVDETRQDVASLTASVASCQAACESNKTQIEAAKTVASQQATQIIDIQARLKALEDAAS